MWLLHVILAVCLAHSSFGQRAYKPPPRVNVNPNAGASDILNQVSDINPDGSFYTKYDTANGISYEEQGQLKNRGREDEAESVQGSASWTSNEGERVSISWLADENGAVFQGDHLPTPPPAPEIPPLIARALAWIAANPSKYADEGQYRDEDNVRPIPVPRRPAPGRRF